MICNISNPRTSRQLALQQGVLTSQRIAVLFDVSEDIVSSLKTQQKSHISLEKYGSLFDLKNYLKTWLQI